MRQIVLFNLNRKRNRIRRKSREQFTISLNAKFIVFRMEIFHRGIQIQLSCFTYMLMERFGAISWLHLMSQLSYYNDKFSRDFHPRFPSHFLLPSLTSRKVFELLLFPRNIIKLSSRIQFTFLVFTWKLFHWFAVKRNENTFVVGCHVVKR